MSRPAALRVRWLGRVPYREAYSVQRAMYTHGTENHLLLLEHPHTYTLGARADRANILVDPESIGVEVVEADRGGDVTYHGPGQLVGYPIVWAPGRRGGGMADTAAYVCSVEQLIIDALSDLGLSDVGRLDEYPGVWVEPDSDSPRKIAAIGVRLSRGRTMHGFALNVDPDMSYFDHIVPCGITDKAVTSLALEGVDAGMSAVVDAVAARADSVVATPTTVERADVAWRLPVSDMAGFTQQHDPAAAPVDISPRQRARLSEVGISDGIGIEERKPAWMRVKLDTGPDYLRLKKVAREQNLNTVCEEAGCPNIFDCWNDGTATFMINGARCTRACGFCQVDTRRPEPLDGDEPMRIAQAVSDMDLDYAVITTVARDDLDDGGAKAFAETIEAIRLLNRDTLVEVLISDCRGDAESLETIFAARPDVLNHNLETVARLQRAVRPSAGYARSLAVLARATEAELVTKSSLIVGMGETFDEVVGAMADLAAIGTDIVTIGQYLRPSRRHVPVARWCDPDEFAELKRIGETQLGLSHVEASPLTRSSFHAKQAAASTSVKLSPTR
jgi:lipoic acid synthetase